MTTSIDSDQQQLPAQPVLYSELADWWPVLSDPSSYAQEAEFIVRVLIESCHPKSVVEFGSGGGNNASHLKAHFHMTLVDLSPQMLAVSTSLNPRCEHLVGDMRAVRLGRMFDAVFIHDAIMYMTTTTDLRQAMETAWIHCKPAGVAVFVPDWVRETFKTETKHGGHDRGGRAMRYLERNYDPDPDDTSFVTHMVYLLREADGSTQAVHDRHLMGLFPRAAWLEMLTEVGFDHRIVTDSYGRDIFIGHKPTAETCT